MYALRALPLGHTAVMCTDGRLNCCHGPSSLKSISFDASRVDKAVKVEPLPPVVVSFSRAEDRWVALVQKFEEQENQWASSHEAWLLERREWEGSRKALIVEISRLKDLSQSLKESTQNRFADKDMDALSPLVQAVVSLLVKGGGEGTPQTRLTPRKVDASTLDVLDSCVAAAEIATVEASDTRPMDVMSCDVDHTAETFSNIEEMRKVVAGETSEGEGERTECAASVLPHQYLSDRGEMLEGVQGESSEGEGNCTECSEISSMLPYLSVNNSGPSDVQTSDGTDVLQLYDQSQLGRVRLKELNVHSYVHNALRASHMRWWLNNRLVDETLTT